MVGPGSGKVCGICYQEIHEKARRCPFCLHWQSKSAFVRHSPTVAFLVVLGAFFVVQTIFASRLAAGLKGPEHYTVYRDQLKVTESRLLFGQSNEGPVVFVVGKIKNTSDVEWEYVRISAEFRDREGKLIDVVAEPLHIWGVMPHGEVAFKVRGPADLPAESYASYDVVVASAEDASRRPW